jgi:hypothetical protein
MSKINNPAFLRGANRRPINYEQNKPCPKCVKRHIWLADENMRIILGDDAPIENPRWQLYCGDCDYQGPYELTKYQAKLAWNRLERKHNGRRQT